MARLLQMWFHVLKLRSDADDEVPTDKMRMAMGWRAGHSAPFSCHQATGDIAMSILLFSLFLGNSKSSRLTL